MLIAIKLNTEDDILDFVNIARSYKAPIDLIKYHHCVDAKSILGVIALGLYESVTVRILTLNEDEIERFKKEISEFIMISRTPLTSVMV